VDIRDKRPFDFRTAPPPGYYPDINDGNGKSLGGVVGSSAPPVTSGWTAIIGDAGPGDDDPSGAIAVSALVQSWEPDLVVHTGDLFYDAVNFIDAARELPKQVGAYYDWAIDSGRFICSLGNHDRDNNAYPLVCQYLNQPVPTFSRRVGDLEVFICESPYGTGNALLAPDAIAVISTWLRDLMLASDARDKVVAIHHPPYSSANYAAPGTTGGYPALRWDFKTWGAKLVLSGHLHNYERLAVDGLTYAVIGNGGAAAMGGFGTTSPWSLFQYQGFGASRIKSAPNGLIFESYDSTGNLLDWVVL
jgi:hypothetical protein